MELVHKKNKKPRVAKGDSRKVYDAEGLVDKSAYRGIAKGELMVDGVWVSKVDRESMWVVFNRGVFKGVAKGDSRKLVKWIGKVCELMGRA
ncbi:hypothetical protein RCL_jg13939.t2 [Rhizophagus clarus]|uniref:Uncharacterized protein n=1 Tax=Rhizophagus clarus TaxID=94130 RepID=A0A8H3LUU7_9GLOM|nr:hypothetical protein RCL_jg13939.t2 [Rhizophagus clarus]